MLGAALDEADVVLVSGGVSVGGHDLVKETLADLGVEELFWRVRIKPGKPIFCGRRGDTWVFGLPGNPVSTVAGFIIFVAPLLRRMQGERFAPPATSQVVLAADAREPAASARRTRPRRSPTAAWSDRQAGLAHDEGARGRRRLRDPPVGPGRGRPRARRWSSCRCRPSATAARSRRRRSRSPRISRFGKRSTRHPAFWSRTSRRASWTRPAGVSWAGPSASAMSRAAGQQRSARYSSTGCWQIGSGSPARRTMREQELLELRLGQRGPGGVAGRDGRSVAAPGACRALVQDALDVAEVEPVRHARLVERALHRRHGTHARPRSSSVRATDLSRAGRRAPHDVPASRAQLPSSWCYLRSLRLWRSGSGLDGASSTERSARARSAARRSALPRTGAPDHRTTARSARCAAQYIVSAVRAAWPTRKTPRCPGSDAGAPRRAADAAAPDPGHAAAQPTTTLALARRERSRSLIHDAGGVFGSHTPP